MSLHFSLDIKASMAFENAQKAKVLFVINKYKLTDDGFEVKNDQNNKKDHKVDRCDSHSRLPKILIICEDHYDSDSQSLSCCQCSFTLLSSPPVYLCTIYIKNNNNTRTNIILAPTQK